MKLRFWVEVDEGWKDEQDMSQERAEFRARYFAAALANDILEAQGFQPNVPVQRVFGKR